MSNQTNMSVWDHVGELRRRLIYVLLLFLTSMVIGFFLAEDVINYLRLQKVAENMNWVVIGLTDAFKVYFQFSLVVAIAITFPFALYQIWAFIRPGLTDREQKVTLSFIPGALFLFLLGNAFGYFWLFPFVVGFMTNLAQNLGAQEMYGMIHYFSFLFSLVLPFGFLFQMPLLVLFLTRLGIITPELLRKMRKFAYFGLFIIAAVVTPPELLSHLFVTLPLIILYEVSIWLSQLAFRKMKTERQDISVEE
jgi:sec-independent protein translocase protein TatC